MAETKTKPDTVKAVVVSDGLTYRVPGQPDYLDPGRTHIVLPARRGDDIELEQADYDRFKALGAITDPDTREASAAKAGPVWGPPANAIALTSEDATLPIDKLRAEGARLGVYDDKFDRAEETDDDEGVSGAAPADLDATDENAVGRLNVAQLKAYASQHGIEVSGNKPDLVAQIVAHAKSE